MTLQNMKCFSCYKDFAHPQKWWPLTKKPFLRSLNFSSTGCFSLLGLWEQTLRLGTLNNIYLLYISIFAHSYGGSKSKIKVLRGWVSHGTCLLAFSYHLHAASSLGLSFAHTHSLCPFLYL